MTAGIDRNTLAISFEERDIATYAFMSTSTEGRDTLVGRPHPGYSDATAAMIWRAELSAAIRFLLADAIILAAGKPSVFGGDHDR